MVAEIWTDESLLVVWGFYTVSTVLQLSDGDNSQTHVSWTFLTRT